MTPVRPATRCGCRYLPPPDLVAIRIRPTSPSRRTAAPSPLSVGAGICDSENQLWVPAARLAGARRIRPATEYRFISSPTARALDFSPVRNFKTVAVTGGRATVVCDAPFARGGTWQPIERDFFAPDAQGPTPSRVGQRRRGDADHRPRLIRKEEGASLSGLSSGRRALSLRDRPREQRNTRDFRGSINDPADRNADSGRGERALYAEPGSLLFIRQGCCPRHAFDAKALRLLENLCRSATSLVSRLVRPPRARFRRIW